MTELLFRPVLQNGLLRPGSALLLGDGPFWFTEAIALPRQASPYRVAAVDLPADVRNRFTAPRGQIVGLDLAQPQIMGIVNVTPDSFSDGGMHLASEAGAAAALDMAEAGATILDIGGESTRPGAVTVPEAEEIARIIPVIKAIRAESDVAISVDTRKTSVAQAALEAGADLINDVSGFTFDPSLAQVCAEADVPVCVMHSQGDPETMQNDPRYGSVVHEVYTMLDQQLAWLESQGIPRNRIFADPGIGFGKTVAHNIDLLRNIAVLHGLGAPLLLGVSRKGFIGRIGKEPHAKSRAPGSIAAGLAALAEGVHVLRVHDVAETAQALRLWQAVRDAGPINA